MPSLLRLLLASTASTQQAGLAAQRRRCGAAAGRRADAAHRWHRRRHCCVGASVAQISCDSLQDTTLCRVVTVSTCRRPCRVHTASTLVATVACTWHATNKLSNNNAKDHTPPCIPVWYHDHIPIYHKYMDSLCRGAPNPGTPYITQRCIGTRLRPRVGAGKPHWCRRRCFWLRRGGWYRCRYRYCCRRHCRRHLRWDRWEWRPRFHRGR